MAKSRRYLKRSGLRTGGRRRMEVEYELRWSVVKRTDDEDFEGGSGSQGSSRRVAGSEGARRTEGHSHLLDGSGSDFFCSASARSKS